jgi:hypothetical protein
VLGWLFGTAGHCPPDKKRVPPLAELTMANCSPPIESAPGAGVGLTLDGLFPPPAAPSAPGARGVSAAPPTGLDVWGARARLVLARAAASSAAAMLSYLYLRGSRAKTAALHQSSCPPSCLGKWRTVRTGRTREAALVRLVGGWNCLGMQQGADQPTAPSEMPPIAPRRRPFRPHFTYLHRLVLTRSRCP